VNAKLMSEIAATDSTFSLEEGRWRGKCLICNGWLGFDARTGFGANIEHIVPRSLGGDNALSNLGLTHPRCNGEKGRRWDPKRRHRADPDRYQSLVRALLQRRKERWRERVTRTED
jgi:5-methylcytosine-specific restriction endonuclease McrA